MREIGIIAAVSINGVIGDHGELPWKPFKKDMARLHSLIDGNTIIVGRRTFSSIPKNWDCNYMVVSPTLAARRQGEYNFKQSLEEAIRRHPDTSIYALGGTRIFQEAFRFATKLYLTRVDREYYGDTYFPRIPSYYALLESKRVSELLIFEEYGNIFWGGLPVPVGVY